MSETAGDVQLANVGDAHTIEIKQVLLEFDIFIDEYYK
jgi:hypothetical protein